MDILTNKWMIIVYVVVTILIILLVIGKKSVRSEINIQAPIETVWNVVTNTSEYAEWNSVMLLLDGNLKEGNTVKYQFKQEEGKSYEIPSNVKKIEPKKLLNQFGGTRGILTFDHKYIFEKDGENTRLIIHEEYRGIMVPFWNATPVQKAYDRLCSDIKKKSESLPI